MMLLFIARIEADGHQIAFIYSRRTWINKLISTYNLPSHYYVREIIGMGVLQHVNFKDDYDVIYKFLGLMLSTHNIDTKLHLKPHQHLILNDHNDFHKAIEIICGFSLFMGYSHAPALIFSGNLADHLQRVRKVFYWRSKRVDNKSPKQSICHYAHDYPHDIPPPRTPPSEPPSAPPIAPPRTPPSESSSEPPSAPPRASSRSSAKALKRPRSRSISSARSKRPKTNAEDYMSKNIVLKPEYNNIFCRPVIDYGDLKKAPMGDIQSPPDTKNSKSAFDKALCEFIAEIRDAQS